MDDIEEPRGPRGKGNLPFPYNQDLSGVLRHLNRRTRWGCDRLANDRTTAAFLAAGMRLLVRHLGPGAQRRVSSERLLLGSLSQRRVAEEFAGNPHPFTRHGNGVSMLRDRWVRHSDFVSDLIGFAVWRRTTGRSSGSSGLPTSSGWCTVRTSYVLSTTSPISTPPRASTCPPSVSVWPS